MKELIKIQSELKVPKGNLNKFGNYKYRSAEDILEAVKPLLLKYDKFLNLTDEVVQIGTKYFIKATACFVTTSKEENNSAISSIGFAELSEHKGMSAEQCTGTASSYARKYALNGLFLIDETEQDPDNKEPEKKEVVNTKDNTKEISTLLEGSKTLEELQTNYKSLTDAEQKKFASLTISIKQNLSKPIKN